MAQPVKVRRFGLREKSLQPSTLLGHRPRNLRFPPNVLMEPYRRAIIRSVYGGRSRHWLEDSRIGMPSNLKCGFSRELCILPIPNQGLCRHCFHPSVLFLLCRNDNPRDIRIFVAVTPVSVVVCYRPEYGQRAERKIHGMTWDGPRRQQTVTEKACMASYSGTVCVGSTMRARAAVLTSSLTVVFNDELFPAEDLASL